MESNIKVFGPDVVKKAYNLRSIGKIAVPMHNSGVRHVQYRAIKYFIAQTECLKFELLLGQGCYSVKEVLMRLVLGLFSLFLIMSS